MWLGAENCRETRRDLRRAARFAKVRPGLHAARPEIGEFFRMTHSHRPNPCPD